MAWCGDFACDELCRHADIRPTVRRPLSGRADRAARRPVRGADGRAGARAAWIIGRLVGVWAERWARANKDPRSQVGIGFAVLMGRAWLLGLTILLVGIKGEREDGLMAALLALVAFTVYFATSLLLRPMERNAPPS
jgi:hypothetical protein